MSALKDVITGRWSNIAMLGIEDAEVIYEYWENDYQGHCEYIVKIDHWSHPEYIEFGWSYGSCSGCDGYEELSRNELIKAFVNNRVTYDKIALRVYGERLLEQNPIEIDYEWEKRARNKGLTILAEVNKEEI